MIPRHPLPFYSGELLRLLFSGQRSFTSNDLEKAFAAALEAHTVLLLPSVRAGILWTIRAASEASVTVVCPAYNCESVHEAVWLSGARPRFVDSAPESFLIAPKSAPAPAESPAVLLLSEVYGLRYDPDATGLRLQDGYGLRIFDLAMCIPSAVRVRQLETKDVALYSFGWGKPLFAGWGGIACFQDPTLAERVRALRDKLVVAESAWVRFKRDSALLLRVAASNRLINSLWHEPRLYRIYRKIAGSRVQLDRMAKGIGSQWGAGRSANTLDYRDGEDLATLPSPWNEPTAAMNRQVAMYNLRHAEQNAGLRREQADLYSRILVASGSVRGPDSETLPQSHFPIRLPSEVRDWMSDHLRRRGVDTSTLWPLPPGMMPDRVPHASRAAAEVITLPLGPTMTLDEVRAVAESVKDGLRELRH